eukprot:350247-Chlamydomonas_euryale.AAC.2
MEREHAGCPHLAVCSHGEHTHMHDGCVAQSCSLLATCLSVVALFATRLSVVTLPATRLTVCVALLTRFAQYVHESEACAYPRQLAHVYDCRVWTSKADARGGVVCCTCTVSGNRPDRAAVFKPLPLRFLFLVTPLPKF